MVFLQRSPDNDLLPIAAVAEKLGVTPGRVRQLVTKGALRPVGGGRDHRFHPIDVEILRRSTPSTTAAGSLPESATAPASPLDRVLDAVVDHRPGPTFFDGERRAAHVRVFRDPHSGLTVIILGALTSVWQVPPHSLPEFASGVLRQLPPSVDPFRAVWFLYHPKTEPQSYETDFDSITFTVRKEDDQWLWARRRRPAADAPTVFDRYSSRPAHLADIEALLGRPLEAYPANAYRPEVIAEYQRTGKTVDYSFDAARGTEVQRLAGEMNTLLTYATTAEAEDAPRAELARRGAAHIADEILSRSKFLDNLAWDDGTVRRPYANKDDVDLEQPRLFAARLVRATLSKADRDTAAAAAKSVDALTWPWAGDELAQVERDIIALQDLADEFGRWSPAPNGALEDAARSAASIARHYRDAATGRPRHAIPTRRHRLRSFDVGGHFDQMYLNSVTWDDTQVLPRHSRELRELTALTAGGTPRLGVDVAGNAVIHFPESQLFGVLWPTQLPASVPDGVRIVADGTDRGGDRPAYLVTAQDRITPLPTDSVDGWNFGYLGGGPGHLEAAIGDLIAHADHLEHDQVPHRWIESRVSYGPSTLLDIPVDELRQHITEPFPSGS